MKAYLHGLASVFFALTASISSAAEHQHCPNLFQITLSEEGRKKGLALAKEPILMSECDVQICDTKSYRGSRLQLHLTKESEKRLRKVLWISYAMEFALLEIVPATTNRHKNLIPVGRIRSSLSSRLLRVDHWLWVYDLKIFVWKGKLDEQRQTWALNNICDGSKTLLPFNNS